MYDKLEQNLTTMTRVYKNKIFAQHGSVYTFMVQLDALI